MGMKAMKISGQQTAKLQKSVWHDERFVGDDHMLVYSHF